MIRIIYGIGSFNAVCNKGEGEQFSFSVLCFLFSVLPVLKPTAIHLSVGERSEPCLTPPHKRRMVLCWLA